MYLKEHIKKCFEEYQKYKNNNIDNNKKISKVTNISIKKYINKCLSKILYTKFPLLLELFKWKFYDLSKIKENKSKVHLYGIYGFFGLPGYGKTMAMSYELEQLRKKYKDKIYIFTNYYWEGQDAPFSNWRMLLKEYDKPCVFAWDEVQNEFNSRDFKNFPVELLTLLTQNRKGNGKRIYYTAQRWGRVDKVFRELSFDCGQCVTILGRLTTVKWYAWEEYEQLQSTVEINRKMKIHPKRKVHFVQTNKLRNSYNSYQMLESAKKKEYITREEMKTISL